MTITLIRPATSTVSADEWIIKACIPTSFVQSMKQNVQSKTQDRAVQKKENH